MKITEWHKYEPVREGIIPESKDCLVEWFTDIGQIIWITEDKKEKLIMTLQSSEERLFLAAALLGSMPISMVIDKLGLESTHDLVNLTEALRNWQDKIKEEIK